MSETARVRNPEDSELWEHSSFLHKWCPSMFRSPEDAYARFQQIKTILANKGGDFMKPCGKQNLQDCDLLKHVGAWNEVLAAIPAHIEEVVETRELAFSFPVKMSDLRETRERIERAVVLLHRLFVEHTCVTTIVLDDLRQFSYLDRFALLCHGINRCRRLKSLRVNTAMDDAFHYQKLLTGCMFLKHLEELCFERILDSENTGNMIILADVIERNTTLSKFTVNCFSPSTRHMPALLRALTRCKALSHLSLDVTCFNQNESTLFLNMLKQNNVLKSLRLEGSVWHQFVAVSGIASALSNSTTLEKLELLGFRLHTVDVQALAKCLVHVRTMQALIVNRCAPVFSLTDGHIRTVEAYGTQARVSGRIEPYIHIIQRLPRLRCFAFDALHFSSEDQREFLKALAETDSRKCVLVAGRTRGYPNELSRIAIETGTANQVHLGPACVDEIELANLPTEDRVGAVILQVTHGTRDNEIPNLNAFLEGMRTCVHVVSFGLNISGSIMALSTAQVLARYLETTKILKVVAMNFSACKESSMVLLHALSRNSSITSLGVEGWCSRKRSARVLADIVRSSKMIHTLAYNEKSMAPSKTFFSRLSESIAGNFTIVSVKTFERRENAKNMAFIENVTTRNATLLEKAARFVAGDSLQKSDAEAFEAVASSPLLPRRVQMVKGVGEREAGVMVRRAVWKLRDMDGFMAITGVVNKSVICEVSRDGRARLDTLPADCWLAIRRYLSVADVVTPGPNSC